jgi:GNAT superfamily N-acetyltransferase
MTEVTVWYLQQASPDVQRRSSDPGGIRIEEALVPQYQFNRFLYQLVGGPWLWVDKLPWTDQQWRDYAERPRLRTWGAWVDGSPAGYFELEKRDDSSVDICYLGLAEPFFGRGFGGFLLTRAIEEAWAWEATRVTVNTCSLDHPGALANYRARGFEVYETVTETRQE